MKRWNGKMKCDEFIADVQVHIQEPTKSSLGKWFGQGVAESFIEEPGEYETNIGNIIITEIRGGMSFIFKGSGKPNLP
jgi:hypothetical protein